VDESSKRVKAHSQGLGSPGLIPLLLSQGRKDEDLLELTECLGVQNPSLIHPQHETLEVLQGKPLPIVALDRIVLRVNEILALLSGFVVSRLWLTGRRMARYGAVSQGQILRHSTARRFFHPGRSLFALTLWKSHGPRAQGIAQIAKPYCAGCSLHQERALTAVRLGTKVALVDDRKDWFK
jgi:hypothetical protein